MNRKSARPQGSGAFFESSLEDIDYERKNELYTAMTCPAMRLLPQKSVAAFFALMLLVSGYSCSGKPGNRAGKEVPEIYIARISFCDSIHDFGAFPAGNPLQKHTFTFTNDGDVPAVILSVTPSCQCTSATYTRNVVRPGEKGSVTVVFDGAKTRPGYFSKSVRIRINSPRTYTLKIEGNME